MPAGIRYIGKQIISEPGARSSDLTFLGADLIVSGSTKLSGSFSINDIEVEMSGSIRDEVLKFNGTKWVSAVEG
ncbi:MAG TPA: hypothetical protein EYF95_01715, partial [Flavobacteriales bacterium]|nr:hypothetical protein [Flavobacteriales bacterium]